MTVLPPPAGPMAGLPALAAHGRARPRPPALGVARNSPRRDPWPMNARRGAVRTFIVNGSVRQVGAAPMRHAPPCSGALMICSFAAVTAWLTKVAFHFTDRHRLADAGKIRARLWRARVHPADGRRSASCASSHGARRVELRRRPQRRAVWAIAASARLGHRCQLVRAAGVVPMRLLTAPSRHPTPTGRCGLAVAVRRCLRHRLGTCAFARPVTDSTATA